MADPKELALQQTNGVAIRSLEDVKRVSLIFVESGMFKSDRTATAKQKMYQAGVKIMAGAELGLPPFASMNSINIIEGRPEMSGNLIASLVKKHERYDYRVRDWTSKGCTIAILERENAHGKYEEVGAFTFEEEDAKAAGLTGKDNWRKYAKAMYFNRAISAAVRAFCPDVFFGIPTYVEGEISGEFETPEPPETPAEGEIIEKPAEDAPEASKVAETAPDEPSEPAEILAPVDASFKNDINKKMAELGLTGKEGMRFTRDITGMPTPPNTDENWRLLDKALDEEAARRIFWSRRQEVVSETA